MAEKVTYDVFISYARQNREWVRRLVDALERASLRVWYDEREIRAGEVFNKRLDEGLRSSRYIAFVFTPDALHSNWVAFELGAALALEKALIPIVSPDVAVQDLPGPIRVRRFLYMEEPNSVAAQIARIVGHERAPTVSADAV